MAITARYRRLGSPSRLRRSSPALIHYAAEGDYRAYGFADPFQNPASTPDMTTSKPLPATSGRTHLSTDTSAPRPREQRERRIEELLESCRQQMLQQIIGPFGLTPAMFDDKTGGNVTTRHNFEHGITATQQDADAHDAWRDKQSSPIDRTAYDKDLPDKRKKMFQQGAPIISAYTGDELPHDGRMHLDHVNSVKSIETDSASNLFMSEAERVAMANSRENLVPAEQAINQSMQDKNKKTWANSERKKTPGQTNAESFGVDMDRLEKTQQTADRHRKIETLKAQAKKQGAELASTCASEAGKNALRQAMGVLLHEFVNSSYVEVARIVRSPARTENLVDRIVDALKRTLDRVTAKLQHAFDALIEGGVQGAISNLLTFIVNNVVTTSAKIVTVIREGIKGLWRAIKIICFPPRGLSMTEAAREATKIIAGVITTSVGLVFEQSVKGFLLSIPFLAPLAAYVAPVITGILTGLMTALAVYAIDRLFDWLSQTGTEHIQAQIDTLEADVALGERLAAFIEQQYQHSQRYREMLACYEGMAEDLHHSEQHMHAAVEAAAATIDIRASTHAALKHGFADMKQMDEELDRLLSDYLTQQ
ncbi:AI-2E family transporter [Caballeronia grimmiae]|uniref:hypothetical protein n=1 Tax=Caballeronia grimmiae TaxID=1071679 RepID=UPI0038BAECED